MYLSMQHKNIKILAISGSLRSSSSNTSIIKEIKKLLSDNVEHIYEGLCNIPHFNDAAEVPDIVNDWRK